MLWYNIGECPGRCRSCVFRFKNLKIVNLFISLKTFIPMVKERPRSWKNLVRSLILWKKRIVLMMKSFPGQKKKLRLWLRTKKKKKLRSFSRSLQMNWFLLMKDVLLIVVIFSYNPSFIRWRSTIYSETSLHVINVNTVWNRSLRTLSIQGYCLLQVSAVRTILPSLYWSRLNMN